VRPADVDIIGFPGDTVGDRNRIRRPAAASVASTALAPSAALEPQPRIPSTTEGVQATAAFRGQGAPNRAPPQLGAKPHHGSTRAPSAASAASAVAPTGYAGPPGKQRLPATTAAQAAYARGAGAAAAAYGARTAPGPGMNLLPSANRNAGAGAGAVAGMAIKKEPEVIEILDDGNSPKPLGQPPHLRDPSRQPPPHLRGHPAHQPGFGGEQCTLAAPRPGPAVSLLFFWRRRRQRRTAPWRHHGLARPCPAHTPLPFFIGPRATTRAHASHRCQQGARMARSPRRVS